MVEVFCVKTGGDCDIYKYIYIFIYEVKLRLAMK